MEITLLTGRMLAAAIVLVLVVNLLYYWQRVTGVEAWTKLSRQLFWGALFAILSLGILQLGLSINDALDNIQDMAPLCAALVFGAPAGITAGFLAAILCWWVSPGPFTQLPGCLIIRRGPGNL